MASIKTEMKSKEKILKDKGLSSKGVIQRKFTQSLAKYMNNYVPYTSGRLKDDSVTIKEDCIKYDTPYARKQYYTNSRGGERNRGGVRGKKWDIRTWNEKGELIIKELNGYLKGGIK